MGNFTLYLSFLGTMIALAAAFLGIYVVVTPYHEIALIRGGNRAAAISMGGTLIGFGIALSGTAASSVGLLDLAVWGAVALACQLAAYLAVTWLLRDLRAGIEADRVSYGITLAAVAVTMGLINAGAVTY